MQAKYVLTADASKHLHLQGEWALGLSVYVGDWYNHDTGLYESILAHTTVAGNEPGVGGSWETYWQLVNGPTTPLGEVVWLGAWSGATTYAAGQGCTEGGYAYVSIQNLNLNHQPPNATWWAQLTYGIGDVVGPGSATNSDLAEFDQTTGKLIKDGGLTHANVADAISKKHTAAADDNFNGLAAKTAFVDADPLLIYSVADAAYRKMTLRDAKTLILFLVLDSGTVQTIATGTFTKIAAGFAASANIDTLSGWDSANKKYVCKEAGVYLVIAQTLWYNTSSAGSVRCTEIYVNGTISANCEGVSPPNQNTNCRYPSTAWGLITLAINDYVEMYVEQDSGGNMATQYGNKMLLIRVG